MFDEYALDGYIYIYINNMQRRHSQRTIRPESGIGKGR